jgi:hypothetical protein
MTAAGASIRSRQYLATARANQGKRVSTLSIWEDRIWRFPKHVPGNKPAMIDWSIQLPNGEHLTDEKWHRLLEVCRTLLWTLRVAPCGGRPLSEGSISGFSTGLRHLLNWMTGNSIHAFAQIDNDLSWEYREYVITHLTECHNSGATFSTCFRHLNILAHVYKQGPELRRAGIDAMDEAPFDGLSVARLCRTAAIEATSRIQPIPDEIALPVMTCAFRMLHEPAEDIIRLQKQYLTARSRSWEKANSAASRFKFSKISGESRPWRDPIRIIRIETVRHYSAELSVPQVVRNLIQEICGAATITIQSHVGLRVSEMAGIPAGFNTRTNLPVCIEMEVSKSGLNQIFYLSSVEYKIQGRPVRWVLGSRPIGSAWLPPPVKALCILEKLNRPWHAIAKNPELLIQFSQRKGLPRSADSIRGALSARLLYWQRDFIHKYVNISWSELPNEDRFATYRAMAEWALRTHAWRKTFALYTLRTDPRMLPAISQHFKHVSLAMTEQNYIGNDPDLLAAFDSTIRQRTARLFFSIANKSVPVFGRTAALIAEHRAEIAKLAPNANEADMEAAIERWVIANDLRIWFSEYGKCLIGLTPSKAACHRVANTSSWRNTAPNFETRSPEVCLKCSCFVIDREHLEFWERRYRENHGVAASARKRGLAAEFYVANRRKQQAAQILRALGSPVT